MVKIRREPVELKPGIEASLICDSSSSNPPAKLSWWREGIPVQSLSNTSKPGLHGGKVSTIELKLNITEQLNGIVYTCQATNDALQQSVHDATTLVVLCKFLTTYVKYKTNACVHIDKPVFDKTNEEEVTGIENEPLIISLKADGNPSSITYTWTKDGLPVGQSTTGMERVIAEGSVLNITKLSRNDAGVYTCEAI